jgi:hypothetical protein
MRPASATDLISPDMDPLATLQSIARRRVEEHRARLAAFGTARVKAAMVGSFAISQLETLRTLQAERLYVVTSDTDHHSQRFCASSPEAASDFLDRKAMETRLATDEAMVRLVPGHHAKYWLAGLSEGEVPRGILFSGDLSKRALQLSSEGVDNSHELMLELLPDEAGELKEFARWVMGLRPAYDVLPETTGPAAKVPAQATPTLRRLLLTKPTKSIAAHAQQLLRQARSSVTVTTWRLDEDDALVKALAERASQLVITVLAPATPENRPAFDFLAKRGAHVLACPGMHAKLVLVDQDSSPLAMVSSANFMREGMDVGVELGLKLGSDDARLAEVRAFVEELRPHCPSVAVSTPPKPKVAVAKGSLSQQLSRLELPVTKPLYQAE